MKTSKFKKISILVTILIFSLIVMSIKNRSIEENNNTSIKNNIIDNGNDYHEEDKVEEELVDIVEDNTIEIVTVGNILVHEEQLKGARIGDSYDFSPSFEYVRDILSNADLSIGCMETTFSGGEPTGYPNFNTPDEFLDDIKKSGIDVLNFSNNHIMDRGKNGIIRTIDKTKEKSVDVLGIRKSVDEKEYLIKEINGEKIGLISYTYETPTVNGSKTINGIKVDENSAKLINTFNYNRLEEFYNKIEKNIRLMNEEGARFIIANIHWGDEYETTENQYQRNIAKKLNELGVDIIIGSHPHVVQPYEVIKGESGKETLVLYSQGNFLSNQCEEEIGIVHSEDGILARLILEKKDNNLVLKEYEIIPTWTYRQKKEDGTFYHRVIPLEDMITNSSKYNIDGIAYEDLQSSIKRTTDIINRR